MSLPWQGSPNTGNTTTPCPSCVRLEKQVARLEEEIDDIMRVCEGVVTAVAFRHSDLAELLRRLRINRNARSQPNRWKTLADEAGKLTPADIHPVQ